MNLPERTKTNYRIQANNFFSKINAYGVIMVKRIIYSILFLIVFNTAATCKPLELVTIDFPPYVYKENGIIKGFNVDILKAVFNEMEMQIDIKFIPWARGLYDK